MKSEDNLVKKIPDGFEIYENPNAQVFLRRTQTKIITDEEIATVDKGMKRFSSLQYYQIYLKKDIIYVYTPNQNVAGLSEIFSKLSFRKEIDVQNQLARSISYSPMLRFVLDDELLRIFMTERF
ncbi:MAG: hypothetical protein AAGG00_15640 [Cyanobacteria bacterium P01_H01_bin.150]